MNWAHGGGAPSVAMSTIDEFSLASGVVAPEKPVAKPPTFARWQVANGGADVDVLLHWHADLPQLPSNQERKNCHLFHLEREVECH